MTSSPRDLSIVNTMTMLARKLEFKVVAEAVETGPQREHLQAIGCDLLQGFVHSRPLPAPAFHELLADQTAHADLNIA